MADTAAHLVTHVLLRAQYRQWVFTVPKPLRLRLACEPVWASWVGNLAVRAIGAWQRVARVHGATAPKTGAVMFVQRFGVYGDGLENREMPSSPLILTVFKHFCKVRIHL
jgi:hypothetical protein